MIDPSLRRRFTLQLTPLLDLVLLVLYAQYIDLERAARREVGREATLRQEAEFAQSEAAKLRSDALTQLSTLYRRVEELELDKQQLTRQLETARAQTVSEAKAREEQ